MGPGLVSVLVELGMEEEARRELARVAAEGLERFRESLWLASLTYLTDACAALGDEAMAALVYPELEPLAGANVMIGHLVAFYGAADRYLGMLAATLGEWERAEEHFERAIELNRAHGGGDLARSHRLRVRAGCCSAARGEREPGRGAARRGGGAGRADRDGRAARPRSARSDPPAPRAGLPGRALRRARWRSCGLVARGLSNREIGARAVHQRAHGRQPHPEHPPQDGLRESHRGGLLCPPPRTVDAMRPRR